MATGEGALPVAAILAALFAVGLLFQVWLSARQIRYLGRQTEGRVRARGTVHVMIAAVAMSLDVALAIWLTLGGGIAWLAGFWRDRPAAAGGMVASVVFAGAVLDAARRSGRTYLLDVRFDGARPPLGKILAHAMAPVPPKVALAAIAGEAFAAMIAITPSRWWLWAALLWMVGLVATAWLAPDPSHQGGMTASQRLADPLLVARLAPTLARFGLSGDEIRVAIGPPGMQRANANLSGAGRFRRVTLSDTLIALLTPAEVEAVLAHEVGHWRCHHVGRDLAYRALLASGGFAALALAMRHPALFSRIVGERPSPATWLAMAAALSPLTAMLTTPLWAHWRRGMEYEADDFAARHADPRTLISALETLDAVNATASAADPLYARFYNAHPSRADRVQRLARPSCPPRQPPT